jgi:hypothetical protein
MQLSRRLSDAETQEKELSNATSRHSVRTKMPEFSRFIPSAGSCVTFTGKIGRKSFSLKGN